jgi:hypothetical protein
MKTINTAFYLSLFAAALLLITSETIAQENASEETVKRVECQILEGNSLFCMEDSGKANVFTADSIEDFDSLSSCTKADKDTISENSFKNCLDNVYVVRSPSIHMFEPGTKPGNYRDRVVTPLGTVNWK